MAEIKIAPSLLAADAANLGEELKKIEAGGADYVHIDVMDGHFVPNLAFSPDITKMLRGCTSLVFDVHLMISEPMKYIDAFVNAGADIVTFHHEASENPAEILDYIHRLGVKAGISVKPGTDVDVVAPYIDKLDLLLIMTVEPGFGGQSYIEDMNGKIKNQELDFVTDYPQLSVKLCEAFTDAIRLARLKKLGYSVAARELTDPENTPKNTILIAIRENYTPDRLREYERRYDAILSFVFDDKKDEYLSNLK